MNTDDEYVRMHVLYPEHPKVVEAGWIGGWLNYCAICYAHRNNTDGFIPMRQLERLGDTGDYDVSNVADTLVEVGLWERTERGFRVHDYLDWQQSKDEVKERREKLSAAGRKGGKASGSKRQAKAQALASQSLHAEGEAIAKHELDPIDEFLSRPGDSNDRSSTGFPNRSSARRSDWQADKDKDRDKPLPPNPLRQRRGNDQRSQRQAKASLDPPRPELPPVEDLDLNPPRPDPEDFKTGMNRARNALHGPRPTSVDEMEW